MNNEDVNNDFSQLYFMCEKFKSFKCLIAPIRHCSIFMISLQATAEIHNMAAVSKAKELYEEKTELVSHFFT